MDGAEIRLAALCAFAALADIHCLAMTNKSDMLAVLKEMQWLAENYYFVERLPLDDGNS